RPAAIYRPAGPCVFFDECQTLAVSAMDTSLLRRLDDVPGECPDLIRRQLTFERGHPAAAVRDLRDRPLQRRVGRIAVRADLSGRSGGGERVTAAAVRLEEQLRIVASGAGR